MPRAPRRAIDPSQSFPDRQGTRFRDQRVVLVVSPRHESPSIDAHNRNRDGPHRFRNNHSPRKMWLLVALAAGAAACSPAVERPAWPAGTLVDLSHDYSDQTV